MNPLNKYEKIRIVGKGAFGIAVLYRKKSTKQLVVIKEINTVDLSSEEHQMALNEVEVLSSLHHPHIIGYGGSFVIQGVLMIEMEYADSGTLAQMLSDRKEYIPEREILEYFRQITSAILYMHSNNILHRDLKTANVFMNSNGCIKIGDFGISKILTTNAQAQTVLGTPYYISPEMCEGKDYDEKSDIWAMGCILYEMCSLRRTFQASSLSALVNKIVQGNYTPIPPGYSKNLSNLIDDILDKNPDKRPAAKEIHDKSIPFILSSLGSDGYKYVGLNFLQSQGMTNNLERSVLYDMKFLKNKIDIKPINLPPKIIIVHVSTGLNHYIALSKEGHVYGWGENEHGELGMGEMNKHVEEPVEIISLQTKNIVMTSAGKRFSVFLTKDGTLLSCGEGSNGVLGHGDWTNCYEPKIIASLTGVHINLISASHNHVAAMTINGVIYTWGVGKKGQTGQGILQNSCMPINIHIKSKYEMKSLHLGYDASMMITNKGILLACGSNNENKLAINNKRFKISKISSIIPRLVEVNIKGKVVNCSIGKNHCAIIVIFINGTSAIYTTGSYNERSRTSNPQRVSSPNYLNPTMIECGPTYTVIGTDRNSIILWGIQYKLLETRTNENSQNSSGIWSQYSTQSTSPIETMNEFTSVTKTYIPQFITQPKTILGLYASPSQIEKETYLSLDGIYPLPYNMLILLKTTVPLSFNKEKYEISLNIKENKSTVTEYDTIGPLPSWIKDDAAIAKFTWPGK